MGTSDGPRSTEGLSSAFGSVDSRCGTGERILGAGSAPISGRKTGSICVWEVSVSAAGELSSTRSDQAFSRGASARFSLHVPGASSLDDRAENRLSRPSVSADMANLHLPTQIKRR